MKQKDICFADLNPTQGREQSGVRPVVVISNKIPTMKNLLFLLLAISLFSACTRAKSTVRDAVNTTGELVGQTAAEFADGVADGVTKTFDCNLETAKTLRDKGVEGGKFGITNDSTSAYNNKLTVYLIFNNDFDGTVLAKIIDKDGKEYGRTRKDIKAQKTDARNVDFVFDAKTHIENQSKIVLE